MSQPSSEETIFAAALERTTAATRAAYLAAACAGDTGLRERVEGLLASHDAAGDFLESPPAAWADAALDKVTAVLPILPEIRARAGGLEGPGSVAGPYTLREPLGEGGMGVVYRAEQASPVRRTVALKIIKPGMDSRQVIARFEAERQALALMDHPNIARVLDAGVSNAGRPYFVMELVAGVPITWYCDEHGLTLPQRLALFVPVCHAVQHAHQQGVIHRDLKPSNVLVAVVDGRPVPKVIDFGVAKAVDQRRLTERTMQTAAGAVVGTPEYMSPEQADGRSAVDTRTDVYALGVLLYELLTGTTPLAADRLRDAGWAGMLELIRDADPPRPSTRLGASGERAAIARRRGTDPGRLTRQLARDLDWVVMRALEKDRGRRYATANALARDVERYLAGEPVEARPPSTAYRVGKFARRHSGPLAAAAGFALLLAGGAAVSTWQAIRATRAEQVASADRDRAVNAEAAVARERDAAVAEKRRADEEAAIAVAVNAFLRDDLIEQASPVTQARPGRAHNPNLTMREALDRAAARVGSRFANQPVVEVAIRNTIARAYIDLGDHDKAKQQLEVAWALAQTALSDARPEAHASADLLGLTYQLQGRYGAAEPLLKRALDGRRMVLGERNADTLATQGRLGVLYDDLGRYTEAERLVGTALAAAREAHGATHVVTRLLTSWLAGIYANQGRYADAERLYREVSDGHFSALGEHHPNSLGAMNNLATLLRDQGRYAEAEHLLGCVLTASRAALGDAHPLTITSANNLAGVFQSQGRLDEAERLYREALAACQAFGDTSPHYIRTLRNLGQACQDQGRYLEAEGLLRQALAASRGAVGDAHPETLNLEDELAALYYAQGRLDEAEELHRRALAGLRAALGDRHPDTLAAMTNLAAVYDDLGRQVDALLLLEHVVHAARATLGETRDMTLSAAGNLAALYAEMGRTADAEALYTQLARDYGRTRGERHPDTIRTRNNLAMLYTDLARFDEAAPLATQVLAAWKAMHGERHPDVLTATNNLGLICRERGRLDEAEPLLTRAAEGQRDVLGARHPATLGTTVNLAMLRSRQGRRADAERLLAGAVALAGEPLGTPPPVARRAADRLARLRAAADAEARYQQVLATTTESGDGAAAAAADARLALAVALRDAEALDEAERHLRPALEAFRRGGDRRGALQAERHLARLHQWRGRLEEAQGQFAAVMRAAREAYGDRDPLTRQAAEALVRFGTDTGRFDPQTLGPVVAVLGPDDPQTTQPLMNLAASLVLKGRYAEADPVLRECLAMFERTWPNRWPQFSAQSLLGWSLARRQRFAEAEPLLVSGYRGMSDRESDIPDGNRVFLVDGLGRLISFYEAWGKPAEAERWRAEWRRAHVLPPTAAATRPATRPTARASSRVGS